MKVKASIKKRSAECKVIRRNGKLYVINKKSKVQTKTRVILFEAVVAKLLSLNS
jgi:large subunit ribosomal protein L36